MEWKRILNLIISMNLTFGMAVPDMAVLAEEPVIEEVTEIEAVPEEEEQILTETVPEETAVPEIIEEEEPEASEVPVPLPSEEPEIIPEPAEETSEPVISEEEQNDLSDEEENETASEPEILPVQEEEEESEVLAEPASSFEYTVSNKKVTIVRYKGTNADVVIPGRIGGYPVTTIGQYAFTYNYTLVSVTIPEGVTEIEGYNGPPQSEGAFMGCDKLAEVHLPAALKTIGDYAFSYCSSLKSIVIPESVTKIGDSAFEECSALVSVDIPVNVSDIGQKAFSCCSELESINVASGNQYYKSENGILYDYQLTTVLAAPNKSGFQLHEGVKKIASSAFAKCDQLESLVIPDSVVSIEDYAFWWCKNLKEAIIPQSVKEVGSYAFCVCDQLKTVYINSLNISLGNNLFTGCPLENIYYIGTEASWKKIEEASGGLGCPATVTVYYDGIRTDYVFGFLYAVVEEKNSQGVVTGSHAVIKEYIGESDGVIIPETLSGITVKVIDRDAFAGKAVRSVYISDSVTTINDYAFSGCAGLESVELPPALEIIGEGAFEHCENLKEIVIPGTVRSIGNEAFSYDSSLAKAEIGEGVQEIGEKTFHNCENLKTVELPPTISSIGIAAFFGTAIESIAIPEQVTEIQPSTFFDCTELETVILPEMTIKIGRQAFGNCRSLKDLELPDSLKEIGNLAFAESGIETIKIPGNCKTIGESVFYGCAGLKTVSLPDTVFSSDLFENCSSLGFILYAGNETKLKGIKTILYDSILQQYSLSIKIPDGTRKVIIFCNAGDMINSKTAPYFVIRRDNWAFENSDGTGPYDGFTGVRNYYLIDDYYYDLIQYLNKSEIAVLQEKMAGKWGGDCYGMSVVMALLGNNRLSLPDIPKGDRAPDLYHLGEYPYLNPDLNGFLSYYQLVQYFSSTRTSFASRYNDWADKSRDDTKQMFNYLIGLMDLGYWVPFGYDFKLYNEEECRYETTGHQVLAVAYDRLNESHLDGLYKKGYCSPDIYEGYLKDGYIFQIYNVNRRDEFEYILVNSDLSNFYYVTQADCERIMTNIPGIDSAVLSMEAEDPRGFPIFGAGDSPVPHSAILRRISVSENSDFRMVSDSGRTLEYRNGVFGGTMPRSDIRSERDGSGKISFSVEDTGDWTIVNESGKELDLEVYDNDRYMLVSAQNADSIALSLSSGTMDLTGAGMIFDVHMTTEEDSLSGQPGHGAISGQGNGTISFKASGSSVTAESSEEMTDVSVRAYVGTECEYGETADHVTEISADAKGYLAVRNTSLNVSVGESVPIEITALPAGIGLSDLTYKSSEKAFLTVDSSGNITGVRRGTASVAILHNGKTLKTIDVTVFGTDIYAVRTDFALNYTGKAIKPEYEVYDGTKRLYENTDYTITYKNNVKAYELKEGDEGFNAKKAPQAVIKAKNTNYSKTVTAYFTITALDISGPAQTIRAAYTGKVQKLSPDVLYEGKKLKKGTDYTLSYPDEGDYKTPGIYDIVAEGKENYKGKIIYHLEIGAEGLVNLAKAKVAPIPDQEYTGKEPDLRLNVSVNGTTLKQGEDYTVTWKNWQNAGTASAVLEGTGLTAAGTKTVTFKIKGTPVKDVLALTVPKTVEFTGKEITGIEEITARTGHLNDEWFTVSYENNIRVGKAAVIVSGRGGYTGSVKKTFSITARKLNDEQYQLKTANCIYAKKGARPAVTVYDSELGTALKENVDYTVSYANNKAVTAGKTGKLPTVTVKGKGNYSGTLKASFVISRQSLSNLSVYANAIQEGAKAGRYSTALIITDHDGGVLKANTDYDMKNAQYYIDGQQLDKSYVPKAGDVITVKVRGKGNYSGIAEAQFEVLPKNKNISKAVFRIRNREYTGREITLDKDDFISAKLGTEELIYGEHYEICDIYNNVSKGKGTVILRGIGEYGGYRSVTFNITQRSFSEWWKGIKSLLEVVEIFPSLLGGTE